MSRLSLLHAIFLILLFSPIPNLHQVDLSSGGMNQQCRYMGLLPTSDSINGFPVLIPLSKEDGRFPIVRQLFETTFIREMIPAHDLVQEMLKSDDESYIKEPLYLLLSGKMGGFPRMGFYLKNEKGILDKTRVPYVDIVDATEDYGRLSSITQIYPHELAHIWYRLLSEKDPEKADSYSSDIHYFSIVTDYGKAFNEGYAESFENLSRRHETNSLVKEGTEKDVRRLEEYFPRYIRGFEKDFRWPLRIGYYRVSMIFWFQQLEDYKRYIWAVEGKAKYQSAAGSGQLVVGSQYAFTPIADPGSRITFRNACVSFDSTRIFNPAQTASNEGVICSFFTILRAGDPPRVCLPKEFRVIRKYMQDLPAGISPVHAFIDGYILEFPEEQDRIENSWERASGSRYNPARIPELWILNRDYEHDFWVMGQFGGARIPFYTFNLNTARTEDLMTLPDMPAKDAGAIIACRDSVGWFATFEELLNVPSISSETAWLIIRNKLIPEVLDSMNYEGEIGLWSLISGPLKRLIRSTAMITIILAGVLYFFFYFRKKRVKLVLWMIIRTYFKALMFVIAGLAGVILLQQPGFLLLGFTIFLGFINLFRSRRRPEIRAELILSTLLLAVATGYSLL